MKKKMIFWDKLDNKTYKKYQFKVQLVQNGLKETKIDWVKQIGPNETEEDRVDLIRPNSNCLIFREKLFSTNFREKIIHNITITK